MALRDTEGDRALATPAAILVKCVGGARLGCNGLRELVFVEFSVSPRDVAIVNRVWDSEIAERTQQSPADTLSQVGAVHQVTVAKSEKVRSVCTLRRSREAKEKFGREIVDQAAIGQCLCVVEFVDDDVVKLVAREAIEVRLTSQGLDRCEQNRRIWRPLPSRIPSHRVMGSDRPVSRERLAKNLLAMADKEYSPKLPGVERRRPGVAQSTCKPYKPLT